MLLSSICKGQAANSWLAFMDQLLVLGDGSADEKECIKEKMLKLIDVHYDALDSSKSGKKMLYGAPEFEESERKAEDIYNDALAIYQITYDYAKSRGEPRDIEKCGFAWKVAGSALCKLHAFKQGGNSAVVCLPSVLGDVLLY
ncbi:hypothetical protein LguiB_018391 [Lonicera macranthoides]